MYSTINLKKIINLTLFIILILFFHLNYVVDTANEIAITGYSQAESIQNLSDSSYFDLGYKSTAHAKKISIISWIYYYLHIFLKIPVLLLIKIFIFLEFFSILISVYFMMSKMKFKNSNLYSLIFTAIYVVSEIIQPNWANYPNLFKGEWYIFPDAIFFIIIGFLIDKKYNLVIFTNVFLFFIHPAKAFGIALIVLPFFVLEIKKTKSFISKILPTATFSSLIYGLWFITHSSIASSKIPNQLWIDLMERHNYHFVNDLLNIIFLTREVFPIFCMTFLIYFIFKDLNIRYLGFSIFFVASIGIIFDYSSLPTLIKLTLHRSSDLILHLFLVGCFYLLDAKVKSHSILSILFSSVFLLLNFNIIGVYESQYIIVLSCIFFLIINKQNFIMHFIHKLDNKKIGLLLPSVIFLLLSSNIYELSNNKSVDQLFNPPDSSYLEIQKWANENTPIDAIFHPDISYDYAWRDFSKRNSFGTPRDFVSTWIYTQDLILYNESLNRLFVYDKNSEDVILKLSKDDNEFQNHYSEIYFQSYNVELFRELSTEWNVDYFIWNNKYEKPNFLEILYENEGHSVLVLKD